MTEILPAVRFAFPPVCLQDAMLMCFDLCSCLGGHWSPLVHSRSGRWVGGFGRLGTVRKLMKS